MPRAVIALFLALACILSQRSFADPSEVALSLVKNAPVHYVQYSSLHEFPIPVISWRRGGLAENGEIEEIKAKIIYPIIIESTKPVAAIVVEFQQANPQAIGVMIIWSDGEGREALISKNEKGQYDTNAYKVLFEKPTP